MKNMSSRLFQGFIHQMKDVVDKPFGVIDSAGMIVACNELGRIGESLGVNPITTGLTPIRLHDVPVCMRL